jgi:hypothetical protein
MVLTEEDAKLWTAFIRFRTENRVGRYQHGTELNAVEPFVADGPVFCRRTQVCKVTYFIQGLLCKITQIKLRA